MAAWKQQLRRDARAEGHSLTPIVRSTPKSKGKALAEQPNDYQTHCMHCALRATISSFPGTPVQIELKMGNYKISEIGACTPARYKAAIDKLSLRTQTVTQQQEEGSDAAA